MKCVPTFGVFLCVLFSPPASRAQDAVEAGAFSVSTRKDSLGSVQTGSAKTDSVTVTNTGTTTLTISSVTSGNSQFIAGPSSASLPAGASRKFGITFAPTTTGNKTAFIIFTHNGPTSPDTVTATGTGIAPSFSANRKSIPYGFVVLNSGKPDSVTVTNTGSAALVISSVTSSNVRFTLSPTYGTIQPGAKAAFRITFTPTTSTVQNGNIVFRHNAPTVRDTVTVNGTGTAFSLNRRSVAFGNVQAGGSARDSVVVRNAGSTTLSVTKAASGSSAFTVSPSSASIAGAGSAKFYITFIPPASGLQSGSIVFTHSALSSPDTVAVSGRGLPPPPALVSPADGSTGQTFPVPLVWTAVAGASGYWLQIATDSAFASIAISDSTVVSPSRQVSGLAQNTAYYWRVSSRSDAGPGPFSHPWTLTTIPSGPITGTIAFPGDALSTSYRMFGLPGAAARKVGDILTGTQKFDWRILRDNGKDTTYPAYYEDLAAGSVLNPGEGYWLLQKTNLTITRTDTLPPLAPDGTYGIPLHGGWNMISNPFNVSILRTAVIAANGLPAGTLFWEHVGSARTSGGTTLDPFKGYYFDNDTANLQTLKLPYPFAAVTSVAKARKAAAVDWRVELVFDSDINTDMDNYIGIAPSVSPGRNELDQHEPPLVFDQGFLYFARPAWDARHPRFAADMRSSLGTGQTWDFEVWNPRRGPGKITLRGLEAIPAEYGVVLVNAQNSAPADMRQTGTYTYQTTAPAMQFKLIVGTKDYVDGETSNLRPQAYGLAQNYPNPFNPSTTIRYMIPSGASVRLEILSLVGQRVRLLDEGFRSAATYSVVWDGKDDRSRSVASGVYFCRLVAGERMIVIRKLLLVK